ncbi:MAG: hypothetical protein ACYTET_01530 [Planctomycetota bacterium]|jgi:hypothetical protein
MQQTNEQSDIPTPRGTLKPICFSLIILLSGVIIGSGLTMMTMSRMRPKPDNRGWEWVSAHTIRRMERELGLSPEQKAQLDPIIKKHTLAMDDIRQEAKPKFAKEMKAMNEGIQSILDEHQKQLWQDKIRKMEEMFRKQGRQGGGGRGRHRNGSGPRRGPGMGFGGGMGPRRGPGMGPEAGPRPPFGPEGEFPPPPRPEHPPFDPNQMQQE